MKAKDFFALILILFIIYRLFGRQISVFLNEVFYNIFWGFSEFLNRISVGIAQQIQSIVDIPSNFISNVRRGAEAVVVDIPVAIGSGVVSAGESILDGIINTIYAPFRFLREKLNI